MMKNRKSKKEPPRQEPKLGCGGLAVQYRDFDWIFYMRRNPRCGVTSGWLRFSVCARDSPGKKTLCLRNQPLPHNTTIRTFSLIKTRVGGTDVLRIEVISELPIYLHPFNLPRFCSAHRNSKAGCANSPPRCVNTYCPERLWILKLDRDRRVRSNVGVYYVA